MKKIGDLFDVQLGKMLNEKAKQGNLLPYLANFNVRWGSFDLTRLNEMTFSEKERKKFSLERGDLLMCEGGEIGRCAVWEEAYQPIYFQKALHRLRPLSRGTNAEFYCYFMQYIASKGDLPKLVGETSIAHLTREKLLCLRVPAPPLPEQTAIASLLSIWDLAIEKTERLIAAKEKQYLGLLSRLITNGRYPHSHIREFATEVSRRNSGAAIVQVLSVTNRNGFVLPEDQFERQVASSDLSNYKVVTNGQYAYNPSRINVGSIARLDNWNIGVLSPMYVVFKLDEAKVNSDFFLHWLESHEAKQRISKSAQGSVRETVSFTDLAAIPFPLPFIDQQKQIAAILTTARQEIDLLKKQAEAYRRQKRGLMQRLLTGEWRVKVS
ncbi:restriction endonuclease subunit S [Trichlorobacter ammonificans]|nr:restriction endonuclease subunit S [Trichlorobacter ammonificans]